MRDDTRLLSDYVENRLRAVLTGCSATAYGRTFTQWSDDLGFGLARCHSFDLGCYCAWRYLETRGITIVIGLHC